MKVNYTWIIIIIIVIFIVNNYLNKNKDIERLGGDPINKLTKGIQNLMDKLLKNEEEPISIISNQYHQEINTKPFDLKKDFISPNPEGSTEFRFVEENPKTAWSTVNVSQHPEYYTSNFEDEKVDEVDGVVFDAPRTEQGLTAGLGLGLSMGGYDATVDYAYTSFGILDQVHQFSLQFHF